MWISLRHLSCQAAPSGISATLGGYASYLYVIGAKNDIQMRVPCQDYYARESHKKTPFQISKKL